MNKIQLDAGVNADWIKRVHKAAFVEDDARTVGLVVNRRVATCDGCGDEPTVVEIPETGERLGARCLSIFAEDWREAAKEETP